MDGRGLIDSARVEERHRYLSSSIEAQMEYLLDVIEQVCESAGVRVSDVVRVLQAHTDLSEFLPALRVWERRFPGLPLPISAVRVPAPLTVSGCSVQLDIWIYAP